MPKEVRAVVATFASGSMKKQFTDATDSQTRAKVMAALSLELEDVAKLYCGAPKSSPDIWEECMSFVMDQYGHLGVHEIRSAFRYVAKSNPDEMKSWYGMFTISMLAKILGLYDQHRKDDLVKPALSVAFPQQQALPPYTTEGLAEDTLEALLEVDNPSIDNVSSIHYGILESAGLLELTREQKLAYMDKAEPLARREFQEEKNRAAMGPDRIRVPYLERVLEAGMLNDDFKARQISIAKKLAILDLIAAKKAEL